MPLPPRPREVRLDAVDPCSLPSEQERREPGLDLEPVPDVAPSVLCTGGATRSCSIGGFEPRAVSVRVERSVTGGIELFPPARGALGDSPDRGRGFPRDRPREQLCSDAQQVAGLVVADLAELR